MTWEVRHGDALTLLRALPSESIHCVVTSPPYWGLRAYKTEPQIWAGRPDCTHLWTEIVKPAANGMTESTMSKDTLNNHEATATRRAQRSDLCRRCGAWQGELGLEPTPELYVQHLVEVFREVRRVLRKDGTLWMNLGDSYAGSAQGWGHEQQSAGAKQCTNRDSLNQPLIETKIGFKRPPNYISSRQENGLKPKDLCGMPWRVAFALQADGWWLRSDIIWSKPNPMPESVKDRPTRSHEYLFLLTESARYFYDAKAISEPVQASSLRQIEQQSVKFGGNKADGYETRRHSGKAWHPSEGGSGTGFRGHSGNRKADGTVYCLRRNARSVWWIATQPFKEAHFATFPSKLVEPCVLAGCPPCGVVLDPFCGSGTVGVVALKLGRSFLGMELNKDYVEMARKRVEEVMPIFAGQPSGEQSKGIVANLSESQPNLYD